MSNENKHRGSYSECYTTPATAVAISRVLGYLPKRVKVQNIGSYSFLEWFEGMANASALLTTAASGIITLDTTTGITVGKVTDSVTGKVGYGFTLLVNTTVNIASEKLVFNAE